METSLQASVMIWGIYPWFPEHGIEQIHPDSRSAVLKESPYCRVFKLLDNGDGNWIQIEGTMGRLKVKPDLFQAVPSPKFEFGEEVLTLPPRSPRRGHIASIGWHYKDERAFFCLKCNGKLLSGRF